MLNVAIGGNQVERKIISISGKRQVTIPQKYFELLGFGGEAECVLQNNAIIIRPIRGFDDSHFSEQILADLIEQGYSGKELLEKFKTMNKKISSAVGNLIVESDNIAKGKTHGSTMQDVFGVED